VRAFFCGAAFLSNPAAAADASRADAEGRGHATVESFEAGEAPAFALVGATVMTAAGSVFSPGYVVVRDGRIAAVGEGAAPRSDAVREIDATGRWVTPGLIDTHSHLGVYPSPTGRAHADGNEASAPNTAGVWAEHSVWPQDPGFGLALAGGVTAMQILPGSANLIGGRGFVVQNVPTRGARAMRFPGAPDTLKMACGENPKRVYGEERHGAPSTRMGNLRGQRQAFLDAEAAQRLWEEAERESKGRKAPPPGKAPERNLDKETLVGVLAGEILPQVHCYRADDMLAMLQLADEFGFEVRSFHHALEAYKIADILAARGVAVSTWADWWGFKLEAWDGIPENLALVHAAGGRAVVHSDSAVGIQRLNQEAAKGQLSGRRMGLDLSDDDVLRWITANPAWALGIDGQTGTLEVGKRADLVLWDAAPLSVEASAERVWVEGRLRYDKAVGVDPSDFELAP
jgi:imidazolonepropionase-like amidohydrolase